MGIFDVFFKKSEQEKAPREDIAVFSQQELKKHVKEQGEVAAIKLVREFSDAGLSEAKEFVDYFVSSGYQWETVTAKYPAIADKLIPGSMEASPQGKAETAGSSKRLKCCGEPRISASRKAKNIVEAMREGQ